MWTCPECNRNFKTTNQFHMCVKKDIGELFIDKPDDLVLTYDAILQATESWSPNTQGASVHSIIFTSQKAWLIIKPMKKELDVKFYYHERIESDLVKKISKMGKKYGHHLRLSNEWEVSQPVIELLRMGFDFSLK